MLVVDEDRDAWDVAEQVLGLVKTLPLPEQGPGGEVPQAVSLGLLGDDDDLADPFGRKFVRDLRDAPSPLGVLGTRHRHDVVVEQLVGDVDPCRDCGLDGELAGVPEGAVAEVLEDVPRRREGRLADPLRPLTAHLSEASDG